MKYVDPTGHFLHHRYWGLFKYKDHEEPQVVEYTEGVYTELKTGDLVGEKGLASPDISPEDIILGGAIIKGVAKGSVRLLGRGLLKEADNLADDVLIKASKGEINAFRRGTFASEATEWEGNLVKGKQWATDNPLTTKDYAKKYGLPAENTAKPDWVVKGRIKGDYKTRPAPASHNNPANTGGGTEILPDDPNNVKLDWFHMPD